MHRITPSHLVFLTTLLILSALISACQPEQSTQASNPTAQTNVSPGDFSLAGQWTGVAVNGDYHMDAIMEFNDSCAVGEVCGYYNLMTIQCAGSYTLQSVSGDIYEFTSGDFVGNCLDSQDTFSLNPDGGLQYTSRGSFGETNGVFSVLSPMPVIYDDDGSPDGTVALMYLLSDPRVAVKGINISYGEAYPSDYIPHIGALLDSFGITDIPLGAGNSEPLGGNNAFPESIRSAAANFWGQPVPDTGKAYPAQDAAQLMVSVLNASPEPITIFISGPCTNLAEALRIDPGIKEHIRAVYIMGGAFYVEGNLDDLVSDPENNVAEWNIYGDPLAAKEVFESRLDIYLVPLDATNQVTVSHDDTSFWRSGGPAADFAANLYDQQISIVNQDSFYFWDIMTAEIMVNPNLCEFRELSVEVMTAEGSMDGQTAVRPTGEPNIHVCLQPDGVTLVNTLNSIFAASNFFQY
jgi:purine nucleosidase/pyrimidine-specific ribonucleoside hydrolase